MNCHPEEPAPFKSVPPTKVKGPPCGAGVLAATPLIDVRVKLEITVLEIAAPLASQTLNCTGTVGVVAFVNCVLPLLAIGARIW